MSDLILPPRGGWVMIRRRLATKIQVPLLSIWYAMPDRLFPAGWHDIGMQWSSHHHLRHGDLQDLYRLRNNSRSMLEPEIEAAKKLDEDGVVLEQRVRIETPQGTVGVEPYEWTPIPDVTVYLEMVGDGVILHEYGDTSKQTSRMEEQIFYMQTRGLPRVDALRLLLGEIRKPNVIWLEIEPEYVRVFDREAA